MCNLFNSIYCNLTNLFQGKYAVNANKADNTAYNIQDTITAFQPKVSAILVDTKFAITVPKDTIQLMMPDRVPFLPNLVKREFAYVVIMRDIPFDTSKHKDIITTINPTGIILTKSNIASGGVKIKKLTLITEHSV